MNTSERALIVDSSGALHSYYHASPELLMFFQGAPMNVNALVGYARYIRTLRKEFSSERWVHVLDNEYGSQYRKTLYPEYKGQRKEREADFVPQEQLLPKWLAYLGEPFVQIPGVESDDLIATLAEQAVAGNNMVLILSQDKDLMQLVRPEISIGRRVKSKEPNAQGKHYNLYEFITNDLEVAERAGVRADQICDYLALMGDASDNIVGLFGVGEKTAAKWLEQYGDLDTIITNAESLPKKARAALQDPDTVARLRLNQKLTRAIFQPYCTWNDIYTYPTISAEERRFFEQLEQRFLSQYEPWEKRVVVPFAGPIPNKVPGPDLPKQEKAFKETEKTATTSAETGTAENSVPQETQEAESPPARPRWLGRRR